MGGAIIPSEWLNFWEYLVEYENKGLVISSILLQYLGWRVGTILRLQCQKVKVQEHQILVEASHCKTANVTGLPVGKLKWTLMPALFKFVKEYIMYRIETGEKLLFTIPQEGALAPWFNFQF